MSEKSDSWSPPSDWNPCSIFFINNYRVLYKNRIKIRFFQTDGRSRWKNQVMGRAGTPTTFSPRGRRSRQGRPGDEAHRLQGVHGEQDVGDRARVAAPADDQYLQGKGLRPRRPRRNAMNSGAVVMFRFLPALPFRRQPGPRPATPGLTRTRTARYPKVHRNHTGRGPEPAAPPRRYT